MRTTTRLTGAATLTVAAILTASFSTVGCKSNGDSTEPSRGAVMAARSPIASYRSQLDQIRPRINETIDAATNMLFQADSDPRGAINAFNGNLSRLKGDVATMRQQVDELQRIGFNQYFLGSDQTTAVTSDPAVLEARERYGLVGDYMVNLRNLGTRTLEPLDAISSAVTANPTAAGIRSQESAIRNLGSTRIQLDGALNQLTKAIDTMPRR